RHGARRSTRPGSSRRRSDRQESDVCARSRRRVTMKGFLLVWIAALAATCFLPSAGLASTGTSYPLIVVDAGPGNQYDIHVSGRYASYTDDATGASAVKYFDFQAQTATSVPPGAAAEDALADVY